MTNRQTAWFPRVLLAALLLLPAALLYAIQPPQGDAVAARARVAADSYIPNSHQPLSRLPLERALQLEAQLSTLGVPVEGGFYDVRAGRWGTLLLAQPLVPGAGVGNKLTWPALGRGTPNGDAAYKDAVAQAFTAWLTANRATLGVNTAELGPVSVGSYENRRLVHIYADRVVNGVPVRSTFVTATLNNGNLVLFGTQNWGAVNVSTTPKVTADQARAVVASYLSGFTIDAWERPELVLVPLAGASGIENEGRGVQHRLAWAIGVKVRGSNGSWEALVDAYDRSLLAFQDRNQYFDAKKVVGGVFPVSNDGQSVNGIPDGIEQPNYPMSRAYVFDAAGNQVEANSEGLANVSGPFSMRMTGPFLKIADNCGLTNESTNCSALNLGTGSGTDCAVPGTGSSAGNTHSGRTGFYEVNRIIDQAKSWLGPASASHQWLSRQLPANMNINDACNAFFSFTDTTSPTTGSINFYRSSADCRNTGEIAAVFDHEWGHGLDFFDDSPGVSLPGEAYADMAAMVRLNSSCIGRGFFQTGFCGGNGDPCTECSGVREADWKKRQSGKPHDLSWVLGQNTTVPGSCPGFPTGLGPCGRSTHCEGSIITEAFWDLLKRDMPCHGRRWETFAGGAVAGGRCTGGQAITIDENSVQLFGTRLFYLAAGGVKAGYQCDPALGGCVASSWYLQILAADDDDGTLLNGTPHMVAVHDAFSRHGIACGVPVPTNAGCSLTPPPATAPTVTATAGVRSATVTWTAVPGAAAYWVMRTDGVHGCNMGKTRVAEIAAGSPLTFTQTGLLDGHQYFYSVAAVGGVPGVLTASSCAGPMSACASVTPSAPVTLDGASASVDSTADPVVLTGDGDSYVDNCETAELAFDVNNTGGVPLTNVRVTSITPSAAATEVLTPLPIALADITALCGTPGSASSGSFRFRAGGLASQSTLTFDVTVMTNELGPITGTLTVTDTETDLQLTNLTYDFENGMQGWTVTSGTFDRVTVPGAGGQGTSSYLKSSTLTNDACDRARSPKFRLTPTSTLLLYNQFLTEPGVEGQMPYYDRGNVGLVDRYGQRTVVQPDGGRLYNADDSYTGCNNGNGWATSDTTPVNLFAVSNWSAAALNAASFLGRDLQVEVAYGTDALNSHEGFQFDQVRLTDVLVRVPDQQGDVCPPATVCYEDSASQIAYTSGWHSVNDPDASGGSFRVHLGNSAGHKLTLPFTSSGSGSVTYRYATSLKGGKADVYIDGVYRETVSYLGTSGDTKNPNFNVPARTYSGLTAGSHTFELRNLSGAVYVDRICVPSGATGPTPAASPGSTSSSQANVGPGQESQSTISIPIGATTISVAAVSEGNTPLRVVVINPLGLSVGVAEATNGIAAVDVPASLTGIYVVKVVNLGLTGANVWTVSTPLVQH
jgi:trimeric autotransporter adhesin